MIFLGAVAGALRKRIMIVVLIYQDVLLLGVLAKPTTVWCSCSCGVWCVCAGGGSRVVVLQVVWEEEIVNPVFILY